MAFNRLAVIGCSKSNLALAHAATDAGFVIVSCADSSASKARQAAARFNGARVAKMKNDVADADAVIMAPQTGDGGRTTETSSSVVAIVRGPHPAVMPFDAFDFHVPLCALAVRVKEGAVGTPGFIRVRHTGGRGSLASALRALLGVLLRIAPHPTLVFGQVAERGKRASQLMVTLTLSDGAIAQLNISEQRNAAPRLEMEVIGTEGLLAIDTGDEVLRSHAYTGETEDAYGDRRMRDFWRLARQALDDASHPFRVDANRAKNVQRIVKRIEKSVATFQAVRVKEPKS